MKTLPYRLDGKRVWIAGHRGMVGSALVRALRAKPIELLTVDRRSLDLRRQAEVESWIEKHRPDLIILAAAHVGGILANESYPADFLYDNLAIELAVIRAAAQINIEKFVFLGSTCIYPRLAPQPIPESALLTGPLEPTNEWYAIAKIAGLKLAQAIRRQYGLDFISVMPTNLYGPHDTFDAEASHVIPALMMKAHKAKLGSAPSMTVWGSGKPRREFLHVDDLANALLFLSENYSEESHVNVGVGVDMSILEIAQLICDVVGFRGRIELDTSKPDGTPRKCTDVTLLKSLGWLPRIKLREGLVQTYRWFCDLEKRSGTIGDYDQ